MPLYEYECGKCAHRFDLRKSFSEGASARCPRCNSQALRVFAPVPIVFKGSGFYVTDYRKDKGGSDEKLAKPAEQKTDRKESKTEKPVCSSNPAGEIK
jgi:putative FmdB family regulatory protein